MLRVVSVDENADKITVQRGYDSTKAEAITAGGELKVIARPRPEGEDAFRKNEINDRLRHITSQNLFKIRICFTYTTTSEHIRRIKRIRLSSKSAFTRDDS